LREERERERERERAKGEILDMYSIIDLSNLDIPYNFITSITLKRGGKVATSGTGYQIVRIDI
jgi:hypothetical protein